MPVIAVVNRKGGSGKSTLATSIASWCAHNGWRVMLGDVGRQQSVRSWLQRRPSSAPPISTWAVDNSKMFRAPRGTTHVVLDTPGALYDYELAKLLVWMDAIVVPIGPSLFDREASLDFLSELQRHPRVTGGKCKMVVVGMRWPKEHLATWRQDSRTADTNLLTVIPDDPRYRAYIENGESLFDQSPSDQQAEVGHWTPLLSWLDQLWKAVPTASRPPSNPSERQLSQALADVNPPAPGAEPRVPGVAAVQKPPAAAAEPGVDAAPATAPIPAYLMHAPAADAASTARPYTLPSETLHSRSASFAEDKNALGTGADTLRSDGATGAAAVTERLDTIPEPPHIPAYLLAANPHGGGLAATWREADWRGTTTRRPAQAPLTAVGPVTELHEPLSKAVNESASDQAEQHPSSQKKWRLSWFKIT
jgi:chromosome partitioning protein